MTGRQAWQEASVDEQQTPSRGFSYTKRQNLEGSRTGPPRRIMETSCYYHFTSNFISLWWIVVWVDRVNDAAEGHQGLREKRHCSTEALLKEQASKLRGGSQRAEWTSAEAAGLSHVLDNSCVHDISGLLF